MDAKMIKKLKDFKTNVLYIRDDCVWTKGNAAFHAKCTAFIDSVPHFKKDFETVDENALVREYSAIKIISTGLQEKYTEYLNNVPPSEDMPVMPLETIEIKQEETTQKATKKKETEIKEGQMSLSLRGGKRKGAGRKAIGIKKAVSISLPEETWAEIEIMIKKGEFKSYADFFRSMTAQAGILPPGDYD